MGLEFIPLSVADLDVLYQARMASLTSEFWHARIDDYRHYEIVVRAKSPIDYRLLYDSWVWRRVLELSSLLDDRPVLELLPGSSLTIPVACQSRGYKGELIQINDVEPARVPPWFEFRQTWQGKSLSWPSAVDSDAPLVVANHIIDDMLFDLLIGQSTSSRDQYTDPRKCMRIWAQMECSERRREIQERVITVLESFAAKMGQLSTLVLRHYPSTFALAARDLVRINCEMETFHIAAVRLSRLAGCLPTFFELSQIEAPEACLYPCSVFLFRKPA